MGLGFTRLVRARGLGAGAAAVVLLGGLSGTVKAGATAAPPTTSAVTTAAHGKSGKLSPRLALLAAGTQFASPRAQARALSLPEAGLGALSRRADGSILVEIRTTDTSAAGVASLRARGAHVVNISPAYATVTAAVQPGSLAAVAGVPSVRYVSEVLAPRHSQAPVTRAGALTPNVGCAPIVSEGDTLMNVAAARTASGVDGTGETVGILSDSFNNDAGAATHAADDVAVGDLPGPGNPCGFTSPVTVQADYAFGHDEGRAMAQEVHDLAPGAQLAFATTENGALDFASQITKLRTVNHASVLVDDAQYLDEPFFQDGPIAKAANAASAAGVPYFSAAGNFNVTAAGNNVSSYEAPAYRPTSCPAAIGTFEPVLSCHNFDPSGGTDNGDQVTVAAGGGFALDMQWAQPWTAVSTDFDLFVLDSTGSIVGRSTIDNGGFQEPVEVLGYANNTATAQTVRIVIAKYSGSENARLKFVFAGASGITDVQYNASNGGDVVGPSIFGHNGTASVGSTAAIPYDDSSTSEDFSSHGPETHYFAPTPSTAALGSPEVLAKPDFAATDGVQTSFFAQQIAGVWRFYGTSAAAPQAAAIGALLAAKDAALTPAQVMSTLAGTARSVATNGTPDAVGGGYLDADAALASVPAVPGAPRSVIATPGNGSANLTWTAPQTDGGLPITGYRITPYIAGVAQTPQTTGTSAPAAAVTGLPNGAGYTFTVAALDSAGAGLESDPSPAITIGLPGTPTAVTAVTGDAQATVQWTAPSANGSPITGYVVTAYAGATSVATQTFGSATTQTVTGLVDGNSDTFRVAAVNAVGTGPASLPSSAISIGAPAAPTNAVAQPGDPGGAKLLWVAPTVTNGAALKGYFVIPYLAGVAQTSQAQTLAFPIPNTVFIHLTDGGSYTFRVAAINARGTGPLAAPTAPITVGTPSAPTKPTALPGDRSVRLGWARGPGVSAETGYIVRGYTGSGVTPSVVHTFNSTAVAATLSGLTNGASYRFTVTGFDTYGPGPTSVSSDPMIAGTSDPPSAPAAVPGNAQATIHWTAPAPAATHGAAVTGYVVTPYLAGVAQTARTFVSTATAQTVTGLVNAKTYTFRIAATNARGTGPQSVATASVVVGSPGAPLNPTATTGSGQATVHWAAPPNNGALITGYVVTPYVSGLALTSVTFASAATTETVTGLTPGTVYVFRVAARNVRGTGIQSVSTIPVKIQ